MGQQQCGAPSDDSYELLRGSLVSNIPADEATLISYCRSNGLGKYMQGKSTKGAIKQWDEYVRNTGIDIKMKQVPNEEKEFLHEVQQSYRFVQNHIDLAVLMLHTMDKQGLKQQLILGVPNQLRWSVWKCMLLKNNTKYCQPVLFEKMLVADTGDLKTIEKDVVRTQMNVHFMKGGGQKQLIRILTAVVNYIPTLGYCQGMNFLVGFLIMISGCDESLSFSCMLTLLCNPRYMLNYMYCSELPLFQFLNLIILKKVEKLFPRLHQHFLDSDTPESFWLTKILLSIFLYVVQQSDCMRLWDYYIARGSIKGLIESTLGLLDTLQEKILISTNLQIAEMFSGGTNSTMQLDVNLVIERSYSKYRLKRKDISTLAKEYFKDHDSFGFLFTHYHNKVEFHQLLKRWIQK